MFTHVNEIYFYFNYNKVKLTTLYVSMICVDLKFIQNPLDSIVFF